MQTLQLEIRAGHMFVRVGDDLFLLDTGAPSQFQTETHTVDIRVGKSSFRLRVAGTFSHSARLRSVYPFPALNLLEAVGGKGSTTQGRGVEKYEQNHGMRRTLQ